MLNATTRRLLRLTGGDMRVVAHLHAIREAHVWQLRAELEERSILSNYDAVFRYLLAAYGDKQVEEIRALHLDARNGLIADELIHTGSVREAPFYIREIIRCSLDIGGIGLILVHNHPSGDPEPSAADRDSTRALAIAARTMEIHLHDHLIVGRTKVFSFRTARLL